MSSFAMLVDSIESVPLHTWIMLSVDKTYYPWIVHIIRGYWSRVGDGTIMLLIEDVTVSSKVALEQNLPRFSNSWQGKAVFHEQGPV